MIKLTRPPCPKKLEELKDELTEEFKETGKRVYAKDFIKEPLLEMSNCKCAYCEKKLIEEGKHMHVEHFHDKSTYPDEVVEWDNLLPSCAACNQHKSTHDTKKEPIVNPTVHDPKEYMYIKGYRLYANRDLSKQDKEMVRETLGVLQLNNTLELVNVRYKLGNGVAEELEEILELVLEYHEGIQRSTRRRNRIVKALKKLLYMTQPEAEYSATIATVMMTNDAYVEIREIFKDENLWTEGMEKLEQKALSIYMIK